MDTAYEENYELEDQFILRLLPQQALEVHNILCTKPDKISKFLKIELNPETRLGKVYAGKKHFNAVLKKMPTITESYKTNIGKNKSVLIKTADICQMLKCFDSSIDISKENVETIHGLTPPLKNVKKKRFRKTLRNIEKAMEVESVVKELYYLLRTDCEAVSSRYQIYYEDNASKELVLFGHVSTDSEKENETSS